jgi:hypothetical protein
MRWSFYRGDYAVAEREELAENILGKVVAEL